MLSGAVLITGSGSGIGAATAEQLAAAGFSVVATVHSLERAGGLRARLADRRVAADVRELDVTRPDAVEACVADVVRSYGALSAVVSNAGVNQLEVFEHEPLTTTRRLFEVNFFGPALLVKHALPHLRASSGRIVAVTSIAGVTGLPFQESYSASKSALEGLLESMAPVAARLGVRISVVEPGPVATDMPAVSDWPRFLEASGDYRSVLDHYLANAGAGQLSGLPPTQAPERVAETILRVLSSPDPDFRFQTPPEAGDWLGTKLSDLSGTALRSAAEAWLSRD